MTKHEYSQLLMQLLTPTLPFYSPQKARLCPGSSAAVYDMAAAGAEGFARPLWGLVPFWAGGGSCPEFEQALCAVLVCLCATAPPVRQAEYPPWDGAPYFDAGPDRVDVNTAPAAELETLPGIGEKKALAIVEYREANGPFRAVEELERVKGISERTVDGMRAYVRVS